jgi:hypothetical protein
MSNLTKTAALEIARHGINEHAANLRFIGRPAGEVDKFEAMALEVVAKGESLSDEFFAGLADNMADGIIKRSTTITRAIHAATVA